MAGRKKERRYAVCIKSDDPDLLTPRKIYEVLPDASAEKSNYIRVIDNEGEDYLYAVSQLAQTTLRNAVGEVTLDELLSSKQEVSSNIKIVVDKASDPWGIDVQAVELKDIVLPESLKRTIAKVAEADREKQAVIINSEGEVAASANLARAAKTLSEQPGALHLRTLQSVNDLSSGQSNTTIWMLPIEALEALKGISKQ